DVVVTIKGQGDPALITAGSGRVKEDALSTQNPSQVASGQLAITDVDHNQAAFQIQSTQTQYGNFNLAANGQWTYTLSNSLPAVQALKEGETRTEVIPVKSIDGTTSKVTITIIGTNDLPTISGTDKGSTTEDLIKTSTGTLTIHDVDLGQSSFIAQTNTTGKYGQFSIDSKGIWTYTLNNNAYSVQQLNEGELRFESFTVRSADGTPWTITMTINGTNDPAVIAPSKPGDDSGQVSEDGTLSSSGQLTISDKDAGQARFIAQEQTPGTYGKFSLSVDGKWTFILNNDDPLVQALKEGETKVETFNVSAADGTLSQVKITIVGSNDKAIIQPQQPDDDLGQVQEDLALTTSGQLNVSEIDNNQEKFQAQNNTAGAYGRFSIDTTGKWIYTLNNEANNVQQLREGESRSETFIVKSVDGTPSSVTITITGSNDAAIITPGIPGGAAGWVKEDHTLATQGELSVSDKDRDENSFQAQTNTLGTYGSFSIASNGKWTYTLNNSADVVQALAEGETRLETFAVKSLDGTVSHVTVTVVGTADAGPLPINPVKEDQILTVAGEIANATQQTIQGEYGSLSINNNGEWVYTLNNSSDKVQALHEGEVRPESFQITLANGTSTTLTVNVIGTNDAAIISNDKPIPPVQEDLILTSSGQLSVSDVDHNQASFQTQNNTQGMYGQLSLDADGKWTYTLNNDFYSVQRLSEGERQTDTFIIQSLDGARSELKIDVLGRNDVAVIAPSKPGQDRGNVVEDGIINATGTLIISDKDSIPAVFQAQTNTSGTYGLFSIDEKGVWKYTLDNDNPLTQALRAGEQKTEIFTVRSNDGAISQVVVTVTGSADPVIITPHQPGDDQGSVTEDGTLSTAGKLDISGVDSNSASFQVQTGTAGAFGRFSLDANGNWNYVLNNNAHSVQVLREGETRTETFTVKSVDGSASSVTVTVVGSNDAATITPSKAGDDKGTLVEDKTLSASGQLTLSDIDSGESQFVAQNNAAKTYGDFSISSNGAWSYKLNANAQSLKAGEVVKEEVDVVSVDGTHSKVTLTITGANDKPVIDVGPITSVTEDLNPISSGTILINDPDRGESSFRALTNQQGIYGKLNLASDGSWHYTLDDSPLVNALKGGETKLESFEITAFDGTKTKLDINVIGNNDAAHIDLDRKTAGNDFATTTTGLATTLVGELQITDVDSTHLEKATITLTNAQAGDQLSWLALPNGISSEIVEHNGDLVCTLSGHASLSDYQTAIAAIRFSGSSAGERLFDISVNDGIDSNIAHSSVLVIHPAGIGTANNDVLHSNSGNDVLLGGLGADTFIWQLGDQTSSTGANLAGHGGLIVANATDIVLDFNLAEKDKLDLADLLQDESNDISSLLQHLHFTQDGKDALLHVSTEGDFGAGYLSSQEDQTIVLKNAYEELSANGNSDSAIIQNLLNKGSLITD
ncbi:MULTISPECIES: VCBS domain-containing protein, partial [Deefgea]